MTLAEIDRVTAFEIGPFQAPMNDKASLLPETDKQARSVSGTAVALGEGEMQQCSSLNSFSRHQSTEGNEFVQQWDLVGNAQRMGEEAVALLSAPQCPSGVTTLISNGPQRSLGPIARPAWAKRSSLT